MLGTDVPPYTTRPQLALWGTSKAQSLKGPPYFWGLIPNWRAAIQRISPWQGQPSCLLVGMVFSRKWVGKDLFTPCREDREQAGLKAGACKTKAHWRGYCACKAPEPTSMWCESARRCRTSPWFSSSSRTRLPAEAFVTSSVC